MSTITAVRDTPSRSDVPQMRVASPKDPVTGWRRETVR